MTGYVLRVVGEPNFLEPLVSLIRREAEADTCTKIITWALTFFAILVLSLSVIGIPLVVMGVMEYARQEHQRAFDRHTDEIIGEINAGFARIEERSRVAREQLALQPPPPSPPPTAEDLEIAEIIREFTSPQKSPVKHRPAGTPLSLRKV
ncbi:MAG: hypothetical protein HYX48_03285 [Chlamydiales bacterium]|nr:hypothetical protein [Chlamydiales bacterium]